MVAWVFFTVPRTPKCEPQRPFASPVCQDVEVPLMRAEYINPFILSVDNTFRTMLNCEPRRGNLCLHRKADSPKYEVSGVIGLTGRAVGTVVLSLSHEVALKAASTMLMAEATEIDSDVLDAVGELTNMVAGGAKAKLEQYELMVSLPSVITGRDHDVHFPSNVTPICVPYQTDWGVFALEVGLAAVRAPVAAGV
jgi:chemotaxis protein CheX